MAVIRVVKNKNYTSMSNYHLKDMRLSLKAKGLLSVILSLPENWDYSVHGLSYICKEGTDAIREAIRELERGGYVFRSRKRNEKGQLKNAEYVIYEEPQERPVEMDDEGSEPMETAPMLDSPMHETPASENPALVSPTLEKQMRENPTQLNIYKTNTLPQKEKIKKYGTNQILIHQILIQSSPHGQRHIRRHSAPSTWWSRCGPSFTTISATT